MSAWGAPETPEQREKMLAFAKQLGKRVPSAKSKTKEGSYDYQSEGPTNATIRELEAVADAGGGGGISDPRL